MAEYYPKLKSYMQQLFQKYFHKVKFYPSNDNFTQALLVMLVTSITSGPCIEAGLHVRPQRQVKHFCLYILFFLNEKVKGYSANPDCNGKRANTYI